MSETSIKDTFSRIPTSVSVVCVLPVESPSQIFAATISSLMSLSVSPKEEEVAFALKRNSYVGNKISAGISFSISVLNLNQSDIAKYYGRTKDATDTGEGKGINYWDLSQEFPFIKSSVIVLECELDQQIVCSHSTIYIAKILRFRNLTEISPLIYQDRNFGKFNAEI